ncbi:MAG: diguanylate cyclase [Acidimicrobiaceae bacterium]|nr:diguanylate cyclase [Acidimicrobiaceae bacterium]
MTSDYESYGYLNSGDDFPTFDLSPEFHRVPPWMNDISESDHARARRLVEENIVISLHDHPVRFPADMSDTPAYNRTGRQHTAFRGLAESGMTVVFDNMMDGTACVTGNAPWRWDDVVTDLGMRQADIAHQGHVEVVRTLDDIERCHRDGTVGLLFGLEAATPIENEIDRLDVLFGLGLRQIGIAYSDANSLGGGLAEPVDGGLTQFGRRAVRRMNQLGLAIDVSHSGDQTSLDVCSTSSAPVFMTHAGARQIWGSRRMKPDDVLRAIAETGGVIGMSAAPHTTASSEHPRHTILSVMDHFMYCLDLVGEDYVTFGPDTLYGDHVQLHHQFAHLMRIGDLGGPTPERVLYVDGLENPTENFWNIADLLVQRGFSDDSIKKFLGGNVLRALGSIWQRG